MPPPCPNTERFGGVPDGAQGERPVPITREPQPLAFWKMADATWSSWPPDRIGDMKAELWAIVCPVP